ncbi:hypothetical protein BKA56DRAFT_696646 [Ilyonectria sp. MPI-CAGE-AT-0026]|nr:hypothetical protein BKA56DRAFT_696646 [Ilyonectria sp. MPI-CAGE-AT-0026]
MPRRHYYISNSRSNIHSDRNQPILRSGLPDLSGLQVLDLSCGFRWFSRYARRPYAIDLSQNMLDRAQAITEDPSITYERADLDSLRLPNSDEGTYDTVFSSLAIHYLVHFPELVKPLDDYQKEGLRPTEWRVEGVQKQHHTVVMSINIYGDEVFEIRGFAKWDPTPKELEKNS